MFVTKVLHRSEILLPEPAHALGALLNVPVPDLHCGEGLPLLWHWIYLLDRPSQQDLGLDGHPCRNGLLTPPGQGQRRMWAGGRVYARGQLRCGLSTTRRSRVLSTQQKSGRSGQLTFVVVQHQILQSGRTIIDEQQEIVYREALSGALPSEDDHRPVVAPADHEWTIDVSSTLLFRFSALTYNAHRVHYDRDYARDVEGYPGLLTHGPLQALAMAEAARAQGCRGEQYFEYRLMAPLFDYQGMIISAQRKPQATTTVVRDIYGRQTAAGTLNSLN